MIKKIKYLIIIQFILIGCKTDDYTANSPNIIIIYTDDLGYGDVSAYGKGTLNTPNIDKLANEGIRVNAIAPGEIETSMVTPKSKKMLTKNIPMKRFGTPEEVAGVIHSMCSDTFSYVNGTEIQINGGQTV